MGGFSFNGIQGIQASFQELARLDDDDKLAILRPAAQRLLELQTDTLKTAYRVISGKLSESLAIEEKEGPKLVITAKGKHSNKTGKRMKKERNGKRRSSGRYTGSNAELLFLLEYGTPRIPASHALEKTNDKAEEEIYAIESEAWDDYLKSIGL